MQLLIKEAKYQETFKLLFRELVSVGFKDGGCVAHSSLQQAAFVGGWKAARGRMLGDAMLVAMVRQRGFGLVRCTRCDGAQIRHPSLFPRSRHRSLPDLPPTNSMGLAGCVA